VNEVLPRGVKPGEIIADKYLIEGALGAGGMGVVLAARHVDLDAPRAIKVSHPSEGGYEAVAQRFHREARIAARLRSEHAARVHDSGRLACGAPYIVMERLEGEDLGEIVRRRRRLPIADAARHVTQACDAVAELHAGALIAGAPDPVHAVVALGVGALRRYGGVRRAARAAA
jgi:serine/threonine-protein kinase